MQASRQPHVGSLIGIPPGTIPIATVEAEVLETMTKVDPFGFDLLGSST